MPTQNKMKETLYLEALPKAVRRAVRADPAPGMQPHGFTIEELRKSDPRATINPADPEGPPLDGADNEHGKTKLVYTHPHDETTHRVFQRALIAQANREHEEIVADNEEDE